MGDIKITNLFAIHQTDETKDKYQVFHTEAGRVLQSMVLTKSELVELRDATMYELLEERGT